MRVTSFSICLSCAPLLLGVAGAATAQAPSGADAGRAGLCRPLIEPPPRIIDTWSKLGGMWATPEPASPAGADNVLQTPDVQPVDTETVHAEADDMELEADGVSRLEGRVWLQQGGRFLSTDALQFDRETGVVETLAPARFGSPQLIVDAETARYDMSAGQGMFTESDFYLLERNARGEADVLARTSATTMRLDGVKYTSCPPEDEDWWLKASSMDIDQQEGMATARNVRVAFMGVPFFYTPWISFPIDDQRKTGFLFPEFGDSSRTGPWLRVPYYLNLHPQFDATLAPYYMQERGTMLESQFRYLSGWGSGTLNANYLSEDRQTDTERYYYRLQHGSRLPADWIARVDYREVSDEEYFQDFSSSGSANLVSHLAQYAGVRRNTLEWGAGIFVQRYQTVDTTIAESNRPYEKWPQLDYYYAPLPYADRLWLSVDGSSVNFQRDDRLSGWRHHVVTALSTDIGSPGLRATPRIAWWQSEYDLDLVDGTALSINRGVPVASLDMLARFERPLSGGGTQSLEPRLFYLNVPYESQADIPRFDTRDTTDTLASLFRENRFTGPDRIGDQNRISFSLESALTGPDGREWLSAAVARAWYLEDRRVQLAGPAPPATEKASNYYAALEYRPTAAQRVTMDTSWDADEETLDFGSIQYQLQPAYDSVLHLAYRQRNLGSSEFLEQAEVAFATPLSKRWRLFGRAVYSLEEDRSQETLAGFEYESCCWIFRTFNRRYIFNRAGEMDQSLWFQLELKGLSSVGRRIDEFLEQDIYGYGETR